MSPVESELLEDFYGLKVDILVPYFGVLDPVLGIAIQELNEVRLQIRVIHYPLDEAVVVLLFGGEQSDFTLQQLCVLLILDLLQVIDKSFDEVLGKVLGGPLPALALLLTTQGLLKYMHSLLQVVLRSCWFRGCEVVPVLDCYDLIFELYDSHFLQIVAVLLAKPVVHFYLVIIECICGCFLHSDVVVVVAYSLVFEQGKAFIIRLVLLFLYFDVLFLEGFYYHNLLYFSNCSPTTTLIISFCNYQSIITAAKYYTAEVRKTLILMASPCRLSFTGPCWVCGDC